jgi:hypothetical protein
MNDIADIDPGAGDAGVKCARGWRALRRSATLRSVATSARALAFALGALIVALPRAGHAQSADCEPLREIHPLPGEALPVDGSIWDICYYVARGDRSTARSDEVCAVPKLTDALGRAIELELVKSADGPPTRLVSRYHPVTPLEVGASYQLDPGAFSQPSGARSVRVVAAGAAPPPPPVIEALDYSVKDSQAEARFRFAAFEGLLVKDVGAQGSPSLAAIDVSHVGGDGDGRPTLRLARTPCMENFAAQRGASASVRFGVFDLAGGFSGWSEVQQVRFPQLDTAFPDAAASADESADEGGCALGHSPRAAPWPLAVVGALALRRVRRRGPALSAPAR